MRETRVKGATVLAIPIIALVILTLFAVSYLISSLAGLPLSLNFPIAVRLVGVVIVLAGLSVMGWVFSHRNPVNVMVSTYVTLTKLLGRTPISERAERTEPLVIDGPQKYVRNPLYFGVIVMMCGWSLLSARPFVLIATIVLVLWFRLVLIPFEERELKVLFGEQWEKYSDGTPMLVPFTNRGRRTASTTQNRTAP
jgi:hypothetical protein